MNVRKISEEVFYVGVNDRTKDKFEGLWPLPFGVSYNSYIVNGNEKIALVDTVEEGFHYDFIKNIDKILEGRKIDYLVVNHMEPDHSGSIPEIIARYPDLKIIGNRQTIGMVKGFYNVSDERFLEIKENDEISLGNLTLRFYLTPMVHWPETMMTYVVEEKILFTGDAFGTFGALNGGVIDSEMDTDVYIEEMYRYYSNIVGKYGTPVQKALSKLSGLEIDYICSTHGPVWHSRIKDAMDIYDKLSRYEGENGVTIVYGSMYGNTAVIAETIAIRLNERGVRNIKVHNVSKSDLSYIISDAFRYKGLIIGSPTYSMRLFPPVETFIESLETREVKNKVIGTFGSYTWSPVAQKKLNECMSALGLEVCGTMEMKQGAKDSDIKAARDLADKVADGLSL